MYNYNCIIRRVVDGDTIDVDIDLGFGVWLSNQRVRLYGIDTPEIRTSDPVEKYYGMLASEFVEERLIVGNRYVLRSRQFKKVDSFGRILGDIVASDGRTIIDHLIESHHAVVWNSSNRDEMREQHLINRNLLAEQGFKP